MFRNYLKVSVRSYINQKYYSLINTLGIAACILILLFVQDELSYEKGFRNNENIYRLVQDFPMGQHISKSATVPFPTKNAMLMDFPDIKQAVLVYWPASWGNPTRIKYEEDEYYQDEFVFAEHSFLGSMSWISSMVAWYFSNIWLNNFAYQIDIGITIFIAAGFIAQGVALLTFSYHTIKATIRNPVESLRYE